MRPSRDDHGLRRHGALALEAPRWTSPAVPPRLATEAPLRASPRDLGPMALAGDLQQQGVEGLQLALAGAAADGPSGGNDQGQGGQGPLWRLSWDDLPLTSLGVLKELQDPRFQFLEHNYRAQLHDPEHRNINKRPRDPLPQKRNSKNKK